jgi:hypothetical protein
MPAVVLFRGPYHVMEYANEEALALAQRDGRGAPVREVFPEPYWAEVQEAMDEVWRSGEVMRLNRPLGTMLLCPRVDDRGHVAGVATFFRLVPARVGSRHPLSRLEPRVPVSRMG